MNAFLKPYIPLVNFIAEVIGPNSEVVLHDLSDLEHSVVALSNSRLTDRQLGSSITDFALSLLKNQDYQRSDYVTNYIGRPRDGSRTFRSSTYFIKDETGQAVGMLCVNVDITLMRQARDTLEQMLMLDKMFSLEDGQTHETYAESAGDLLDSLIAETCAQFPQNLSEGSAAEKRRYVSVLAQQGGFLLKGAVSRVSGVLGVSEQTVYRYLKEVQ